MPQPGGRYADDVKTLQGEWKDREGNRWTVSEYKASVSLVEGDRQHHVLQIAGQGKVSLLGSRIVSSAEGEVHWEDGDVWTAVGVAAAADREHFSAAALKEVDRLAKLLRERDARIAQLEQRLRQYEALPCNTNAANLSVRRQQHLHDYQAKQEAAAKRDCCDGGTGAAAAPALNAYNTNRTLSNQRHSAFNPPSAVSAAAPNAPASAPFAARPPRPASAAPADAAAQAFHPPSVSIADPKRDRTVSVIPRPTYERGAAPRVLAKHAAEAAVAQDGGGVVRSRSTGGEAPKAVDGASESVLHVKRLEEATADLFSRKPLGVRVGPRLQGSDLPPPAEAAPSRSVTESPAERPEEEEPVRREPSAIEKARMQAGLMSATHDDAAS